MGGDKRFFQSWKICVLDEKAFVRTSVSELDEDGGGFMGGSTHIVRLDRLIAVLALLGAGDADAANVALLGDVKLMGLGKCDLRDDHLSAHHLTRIRFANLNDDPSFSTVRWLKRLAAKIKFKDDCNMDLDYAPYPSRSATRTVDCIGELFAAQQV